MRILLAILLALAVGGCGGCASVPDYHASTARLLIGRGICSGTAVGKHLILTAAHCFPSDVPIVMVNGRIANVAKIIRDGNDHALLQVDIKFDSFAVIGANPVVGDGICLYGNPGGLTDIFRCGMVSGQYKDETLYNFNGYLGDSGAGIFNKRGQLVGVVMGGFAWWQPTGMHFQMMRSKPLAFTAKQWAEIG